MKKDKDRKADEERCQELGGVITMLCRKVKNLLSAKGHWQKGLRR